MGLLLVGEVLTIPRPMGQARKPSPVRVLPQDEFSFRFARESRGTRLQIRPEEPRSHRRRHARRPFAVWPWVEYPERCHP